MRFNIYGVLHDIDRERVVEFAKSKMPNEPDGRYKYFVKIEGRRYPIKQLIAGVTQLSSPEFTADYARRILKKLGFTIEEFGPLPPRPHFKSKSTPSQVNGNVQDNQDTRGFAVSLERDEDGFYVVSCPELPGCHSQGRTREEALNNISQAIRGYLASMQKHEEALPETDWEVVEVTL
jgi:predicted RNase H-like HicB family nuclease